MFYLNSNSFPEDPQESLELFRKQLVEYSKGGFAPFELQNVIVPHAAVCDPAVLYAELPERFQEWVVERCGEFLSPETEVFTISSSCSSFGRKPPRIISDEEKLKMEQEEKASEQRYRKGYNRFYEFLRKTGKIPS